MFTQALSGKFYNMSYNRQPQTVLAGTALVQNPPPSVLAPAGILPVTLDCEIATASTLGVIQVGSGLNITPQGVLSAISNPNCCFMNVHVTSRDYTATDDDCYIGADEHHREDDNLVGFVNSVIPITHNIQITLPLGILGKVYVIKNQDGGNVKVTGTGGQQINTLTFKTLGAQDAVTVIFDGTKWNTI